MSYQMLLLLQELSQRLPGGFSADLAVTEDHDPRVVVRVVAPNGAFVYITRVGPTESAKCYFGADEEDEDEMLYRFCGDECVITGERLVLAIIDRCIFPTLVIGKYRNILIN